MCLVFLSAISGIFTARMHTLLAARAHTQYFDTNKDLLTSWINARQKFSKVSRLRCVCMHYTSPTLLPTARTSLLHHPPVNFP